jgi:trehalose 6-phosphate synthase/phosphatase
MSRLIIVSNRLPFSIDKNADEPLLRQSSGGLVSALISYFERNNESVPQFSEHIWIGSVDFSPQDWNAVAKQARTKDFTVEPVFIEPAVYENYYNGFSNSTLWPLFHYFPSLAEFDEEYYEASIQVNFQFAEKILSIANEDDVIWVHDYQLMLLPQILRKKNSELSIGFFLHIPFPSYEIFRLLPTSWKTNLLKGMLGADLIGFHTHDYVRHFIQSCKMILKVDEQFNTIHYQERLIKADLFPLGVDYEKFNDANWDEETIELKIAVKEKMPGTKIIFSVDRLDYSKGLMHRLQGYEEFLENYPEWLEQVVFIFNIVPSRDAIAAYIDWKKQIEEKISQLNGKFSTMNWQPIIYRYNHVSFKELAALYQLADVALITPLRDGMNLVAKEFVASRSSQDGVLILSELAGAASELGEAVMVNPTDSKEVSNAINQALKMPLSDQKHRMEFMQRRLKEYDVVRWVKDFLEQLENIKKEQIKQSVKLLDTKSFNQIIDQFNEASSRCILLDYDGTLAPFTRIPAEAKPNSGILNLLKELAENEKNEVVIISGRDPDTLNSWLGKLPVSLVAEHGGFIKRKNKNEWEKQSAAGNEWKDQLRPILELFVTRTTGSLMEEKKNTLTWHYRNTHPDLGFIRSRELLNNLLQLTANTHLQVVDGNKVIEVRLQGIDKGIAALKLVNIFEPEFVLCIGDDATDEDMFKILNDKAITIKVGSGGTAAQFNIRSQLDVAPFLERFLDNSIEKKESHSTLEH